MSCFRFLRNAARKQVEDEGLACYIGKKSHFQPVDFHQHFIFMIEVRYGSLFTQLLEKHHENIKRISTFPLVVPVKLTRLKLRKRKRLSWSKMKIFLRDWPSLPVTKEQSMSLRSEETSALSKQDPRRLQKFTLNPESRVWLKF